MEKKLKKVGKSLIRVIDHMLFVISLTFAFIILPFLLPWILKQRRTWINNGKGNSKILFIQKMNPEISKKIGFEYLLRFRNPCFKWIGFFDPVNTLNADTKIASDVSILLKKLPKFATLIAEKGFGTTAK